jgi:hypothetical protein
MRFAFHAIPLRARDERYTVTTPATMHSIETST